MFYAGIDLITEGITTSLTVGFWQVVAPAGIDLITEGITTCCQPYHATYSLLLELT